MQAVHLPELRDTDYRGFGELAHGVTYPQLTTEGVERICRALIESAERLRQRPVAEIVAAIDAAAGLLMTAGPALDELTAAIAEHTHYSIEMSAHVIERMAADWRSAKLFEMLHNELRDPRVLDGFVQVGSVRQRVTAPQLSLHVFSGNVPGVAVTSIIRALLVKSAVLGKAASGEPLLAAAFAHALSTVDRDVGAAVAIAYWPGGTEDLESAALRFAGAVVHYGSDESITDMRRRLPPHTELVEHGPRISFGLVARDALEEHSIDALANDIAYAVATFDQQGCVSPHVLYVETGGRVSPRQFAVRIATALADLQRILPAGPIGAREAISIRATRSQAEFRAIAGRDVLVYGPPSLEHTVIYDDEPAFAASCLSRTIRVHPVGDLAVVPPLVAPYRAVLQSAAIAGGISDGLLEELARAGVTRVTRFRDLPWPSASSHHDGRSPLELLRWVDADP